jgi:flagellar assembly factor FliW
MKTAELIEPLTNGVKRENLIQFPLGLLGFEQVKGYVLLSNPGEEPFLWLQMVDNARRAFLVISPSHVAPDYQPDISAEDVDFLGLRDPADAIVLNIVTLRGKSPPTVNMKGPIILNRNTLIGKQVIPNNAAKYTLNHPLPVS